MNTGLNKLFLILLTIWCTHKTHGSSHLLQTEPQEINPIDFIRLIPINALTQYPLGVTPDYDQYGRGNHRLWHKYPIKDMPLNAETVCAIKTAIQTIRGSFESNIKELKCDVFIHICLAILTQKNRPLTLTTFENRHPFGIINAIVHYFNIPYEAFEQYLKDIGYVDVPNKQALDQYTKNRETFFARMFSKKFFSASYRFN